MNSRQAAKVNNKITNEPNKLDIGFESIQQCRTYLLDLELVQNEKELATF